MPVHHLKMLGRHGANYLLYHLNTAHTNVAVSRSVQRWSTISRCWSSVAPTIVQKTHTIPAIMPPVPQPTSTAITDSLCFAIGTRCWLNAGSTLLVRLGNKALAQNWVNAYNSFFIYIYIYLLPTDISE